MEPGRVHLLGPFEVEGLAVPRLVRVYVPHRARSVHRPALVLFDGQNVFDDEPSFAGGWHAHRAVERLARNVSPPVVIGIDHGREHRLHELSPFDVRGEPGRADLLLGWMTGTLIPELRSQLQLDPDPRRVVVGGSSMGGLAALYAHGARPDVFGGALAMSPALWVAGNAILSWLADRQMAPWSRVYLDAGRGEGRGALVRDAGNLAAILRQRYGEHVSFRDDPRGQHREACWRRRLPGALRFFFGTSRAPRLRT